MGEPVSSLPILPDPARTPLWYCGDSKWAVPFLLYGVAELLQGRFRKQMPIPYYLNMLTNLITVIERA